MILTGSISEEQGPGITGLIKVDGEVRRQGSYGIKCCSFLLSAGEYILSTVETDCIDEAEGGGVLCLKRDDPAKETGRMTGLSKNLCHLSFSEEEHLAAASSYAEGTIEILQLAEDGSLQKKASIPANGRKHAHSTAFYSPDRCLYACYLGSDLVTEYALEDFSLKREIRLPKGAGPRHMLISPEGKFLYVSCELDNHIYVIERKTGTIRQSFDCSIKDGTFCALSFLRYFDRGKTVAAGRRGGDGIFLFDVESDASLCLKEFIKTPGDFLWDACQTENGDIWLADFNEDQVEMGRFENGWRLLQKTAVRKPSCFLVIL